MNHRSVQEIRREIDAQQNQSDYDKPVYSDPYIKAGLDSWHAQPGSPYDYSNYLVYKNRPYSSRFINIDSSGARLNGSGRQKPNEPDYEIWMIGSSAVFGITNADTETVPAFLEQKLSEHFYGKTISVRNLGVAGYTSLQDYLNFKLRLLHEQPDMVIIFSGMNDFNISMYPKIPLEDTMLYTGVNSDILHDYWDWHSESRWINWHLVGPRISALFSNTIQLIEKAQKWFALREANSDIESWKSKYRAKRKESAKRIKPTIEAGHKFFINNVKSTVSLALRNGIEIIVAQQPYLFATRKQLVAQELSKVVHGRLSHFTLSDEELDALTEIPPYRLSQTEYWHWESVVSAYEEQKTLLSEYARSAGITYIDVMPAIDKAGQMPVFSTPIHYTYRGAELVAGVLLPDIKSATKKRLRR